MQRAGSVNGRAIDRAMKQEGIVGTVAEQDAEIEP
jgi:hypothetical protein